jgi:hypothetical protein
VEIDVPNEMRLGLILRQLPPKSVGEETADKFRVVALPYKNLEPCNGWSLIAESLTIIGQRQQEEVLLQFLL